jgi:O-antigen ligase
MKERPTGYLHLVLPAVLAVSALAILLSGRDLSRILAELEAGPSVESPIIVWAQRALSILLVVVSAERVINHLALRKPMPSPLLTTAFITFWLGTMASPALLGEHPMLSHEFLYPLIMGTAFLLATGPECDLVIDWVRTALFLVLLASVLLTPVMPALTLDQLYTKGLLAGLPRFGGLAPHPVAMGMYALTFLVCLWCRPFARPWQNRFAWLVGLGVLFFAQSKNSWIAFLICSAVLLLVRNGPNASRRLADPREGAFGVVLCVVAMVLVTAVMGVILLGDLGAQTSDFMESTEGAQLVSMTGRDQIWAVALEEWREHPLFGYGPGIWDDAFRASIGIPYATHGHNQFLDTLARSGTVGGIALVLFALVLLALSLRYAKATGGLSLALFLSLALRSISEVPLLLMGYGTELMVTFLLLVTLASAASRSHQAEPAPSPTARRVAT